MLTEPSPARPRHRYQEQNCPMTIREGLDEYRHAFAGLVDENTASPQGHELFHNHDLCHVVFGLDTSIGQEAMADIWTIFGTDVGALRYAQYLRAPEVQQVYRDLGTGPLLRESLRSLPLMWRAYRHARRMKKPWPWDDHARYLDRPIAEVRAELGIEVAV